MRAMGPHMATQMLQRRSAAPVLAPKTVTVADMFTAEGKFVRGHRRSLASQHGQHKERLPNWSGALNVTEFGRRGAQDVGRC